LVAAQTGSVQQQLIASCFQASPASRQDLALSLSASVGSLSLFSNLEVFSPFSR